MRYRALEGDGDMIAGHGSADYLQEAEAVGQAVKTRLLLLYNEWWEDAEDGLPLFEKIAGTRDTGTAELEIRKRIASTRDVTDVLDFTTSLKDRKFAVTCTVNTVYGQTTVEVSL